MQTIIKYLLTVISYQYNIIISLFILSFGKKFDFLPNPKADKPIDKKYRKLNIDSLPLIKLNDKLDFNSILQKYLLDNGKPLKTIKHKHDSSVSSDVICPVCGAPHSYIYDNNGGKGQFLCKVCKHTFFINSKPKKEIVFLCPHCGASLELIKHRKNFDVFKCKNDLCSFYANNFNSLSNDDKVLFKLKPHSFKLRYIFRKFNFDFKPLDKNSPVNSKVNLPNIRVSSHTLGLILSYNINFALSARATSKLLKEIHGISVSYQSVLNYSQAASVIIKPFVDSYPYELSDSFCGDETYIKVKGIWNYIFFFFDAKKKIILSNFVSPNRDTFSAIKAIDLVLKKFSTLPDKIKFIVDGNPIYLLAQHFFASHGILFDIEQVIGLTNSDPVSKEHRPLKQIIERLNRTFKHNYKPTCGFGSADGSIAHVTLFTAYFNFLRDNSALGNKVPVFINDIDLLPHMPAKWAKLISLAQDFIADNSIPA